LFADEPTPSAAASTAPRESGRRGGRAQREAAEREAAEREVAEREVALREAALSSYQQEQQASQRGPKPRATDEFPTLGSTTAAKAAGGGEAAAAPRSRFAQAASRVPSRATSGWSAPVADVDSWPTLGETNVPAPAPTPAAVQGGGQPQW
jgi:hypothetical protein